jgi:1,4-alpha-glucan branching enzyme
MISKGSRQNTTKFSVKPNNAARTAQLAGDFNGWKPAAMKKQKDGAFVAEVPLKAGSYQYKFVVDGQWVADPDNANCALNPYGSVNSVARIE